MSAEDKLLKDALEYIGTMPSSGYVADAFLRLGLKGWIKPMRTSKPEMTRCIAGPAVTVQFAPIRGAQTSTRTLYEVFREMAPGSFVAIAAPSTSGFLLGANVCAAAIEAHARGLLVDGWIRDTADIEKLELVVFHHGSTVRREDNAEIVAVNQPIVCCGAAIHPGDIIVVDRDGGLVIPPQHLGAVLNNARDIERIETQQGELIRNRGSLEDLKRVLAAKKKPCGQ